MNDWGFAQADEAEQLARVHLFSVMKIDKDREIEVTISIKEYYTPKDPAIQFFAQADKQMNQGVAPYTPTGWGPTLLSALAACLRELKRFPYQG